MKFKSLVAVVFVLVALVSPAAAQEKPTETERLNTAIAELKAPPASLALCGLLNRYVRAEELVAKITDPDAKPVFDIKIDEAQSLKLDAAQLLLERAALELRAERSEELVCSGPTGDFEWTIWGNKYELIQAIRSLKRRNRLSEYNVVVVRDSELSNAMLKYAVENAAKFLKEWQKEPEASFNHGLTMLWHMLCEEEIAPSALGLNAQQTFQILELTGRKPANAESATANRN